MVARPLYRRHPSALVLSRDIQLHFSGRTALHRAHQFRDGAFRMHRHKQMDMIIQQHPAQDVDLVLVTDLTAGVDHPQVHLTSQHLVAVFRRPDDEVAVQLLPISISVSIWIDEPKSRGKLRQLQRSCIPQHYTFHRWTTTWATMKNHVNGQIRR